MVQVSAFDPLLYEDEVLQQKGGRQTPLKHIAGQKETALKVFLKSTQASHPKELLRRRIRFVRKKSMLGVQSTTADDLLNTFSRLSPIGSPLESYCTSHIHHSELEFGTFIGGLEDTLFASAGVQGAVHTTSIPMIADIRASHGGGGRLRLPFTCYLCHSMWVGCIRPETSAQLAALQQMRGRYQVCLMCAADEVPVPAGRPMTLNLNEYDAALSTSAGDIDGVVRVCQYQDGLLMRGMQAAHHGSRIRLPIRVVLSFSQLYDDGAGQSLKDGHGLTSIQKRIVWREGDGRDRRKRRSTEPEYFNK